jgi:hypothetical protein
MKQVLASLAIILLCSCGGAGFTGYASRDLGEVVILLNPDSGAMVTGIPLHGTPVEFANHLTTPGVTQMKMWSSPQDTTGIQRLQENAAFPVLFDFGEPRVTLHLDGLHWELRISQGSSTTGTAIIRNNTGETWTADIVELAGEYGVIARSSGPVRIPPEGAVFPWWELEAARPDTILMYDFPVQGRWNAVIAIPLQGTPPPLPQSHEGTLTSDTLWLPADNLIQTDLTWTRRSNGYSCTLELRSTSDKEVNYRVILPDRLPRGAVTQPGEGFSQRITLPAGHSTQLRYTEVYQR